MTNEQLAIRISRNTIFINIILTAFKLFAGIFANSAAMLADAIHSASDALTTIFVIIFIKISHKESDKEHPYGHERMECVAAILLAAVLLAVGAGIGYSGVQKIIAGNYAALAIPGLFALAVAVVSVVLKEWMYWYTRAAAKKINSGALMADAWHHRSDGLSSIGSFLGILGARLGFPVLDSVACVVICVFIGKVAFDIFMDAIGKMTDKACDDELVEEIRAVIALQPDVLGIDTLKTRLFGNKIYVDVAIRADGNATLNETHTIAQDVHDAIETLFPNVKHCTVQVTPEPAGDDYTV